MSSNHQDNRELQREARAWAKFAGTTYARALKQVVSPLARGLLGEPLSPRQLIAALHDHPVIGDREGRLVLGQYGFTTEAHTVFSYRGGEKFSFTGDDDMWVFLN